MGVPGQCHPQSIHKSAIVVVTATVETERGTHQLLTRFNKIKELHPVAVQGIYNITGIDLIGPVQTMCQGRQVHHYLC